MSTISADKLLLTIGGFLLTVCMAISGWAVAQIGENADRIASHDGRLSVIESTRFTATDALEVWREIAEVREDLARVPTEIPPTWLRDKVAKNSDTLVAMEQRLAAIAAAIAEFKKK